MDSSKARSCEKQAVVRDPLWPLRKAAARRGVHDVRVRWLEAIDLPASLAPLLNHSRAMTSTLAKFHDEPIGVVVRSREWAGDAYWREVILRTTISEKDLIYACLDIRGDLLDANVRQALCREDEPFGAILKQAGNSLRSIVQGFFSISGALLNELVPVLGGERRAYGRCSHLLIGGEVTVAHVVEVLL